MTDTAAASAEALTLLRTYSKPTAAGYVTLNAVPYRAHHLLLTESLRTTSVNSEVFEGGVSSGYFARTLVEAGRTVDGHELDPTAADEAREVCRTVYEGDLQQFGSAEVPETVAYDLLVFGDTLEHISDPASMLQRLSERLRPGGHLVVSVPNIANWSIRLQLLAGRFRYVDRGIMDSTHVRFYTRRTLVEMVESAGFTVEKVQAAVPVPGVTSEGMARLTHRIGNLLPGLFAYNFVVTARKT